MAPQPVVTGLSPKEGPPGTRVIIRGTGLGTRSSDLIGLSICGCDCLLSAEWKSVNKIIARTGAAKGKGDIIVTTLSGGIGSSTVQFRAYHETIGPMKESAVWIEESPMQSLAWGRRTLAPTGYSQEDPLGLSIEGNEKKFPEDLRDIFPESSGDLSQENFSPGWFLLENHHATTFEDLKAGLAYLKRKVESQKEGQLSFLKSNAGSVIEQLDTLMTIRDKFNEDIKIFGNEPLCSLEGSIQNSISESYNIFNEVLQRREKADSTRAALFALSRHKFLFCLPNSVDRSAKTGDYDIVVNDYSRAKNLFGKTEIPIFKKVLDEVDERIIGIRKQLFQKVVKMPQTVDQQKKLIKALINLEIQQAGVAKAEKLRINDPAWDAIDTRAKYMEEIFKKTFDQYLCKESGQESKLALKFVQKLKIMKARKENASQHRQSATINIVQDLRPDWELKNREQNQPPNRVLFCEEICEIAACQLPDLWRLGQSYFTGELRGANDPQPGDFKRIILNGIEMFCSYIRASIFISSEHRAARNATSINWPNITNSAIMQFQLWVPQCLRFVRITYATFIRLDVPSEVLDIVQKLIDELRLYCFAIIFKRSIEKVKKLGEQEKWIMGVPDFPGVTLLPSLLEETITETLEEGQNMCMNPEVREGNLLEPLSDGQREVSQKLQEILNAFCDVVENLAIQIQEENHAPNMSQLIGFPNAGQNGVECKTWSSAVVPWEQRMLCCLANTSYCYKIFFAHIGTVFVKFGYPLPKMAIESSRSTVNQLFTNLLETYVENKGDPLVGTIEPSMYIGRFQWDTVKEVGKLRPYAHECCDNLVGVYSEIFTISPFLLRPILEPIVQTVAEELARLMSCVQKFNSAGTVQAHVDIRLIRDALKLYSNESAKSFFHEALEAITALTDEEEKQVIGILQHMKKSMKLQLLCFSVANP